MHGKSKDRKGQRQSLGSDSYALKRWSPRRNSMRGGMESRRLQKEAKAGREERRVSWHQMFLRGPVPYSLCPGQFRYMPAVSMSLLISLINHVVTIGRTMTEKGVVNVAK